MSKETTVGDVIGTAKKDVPFQERAVGFEKELSLLVEKWGVMPGAEMQYAAEGIIPIPNMRDLWALKK